MNAIMEGVERMYRLVWRERDIPGAFTDLPEGFEWVVPGHPEGAVRRGPGAVEDFFVDWVAQWESPETDWTLEQTGPDTVLALCTTRGRGKASGVPVEVSYGQVWTFRDGTPARMVLYADPGKARQAADAGAGEPS